MRFLRDDVGSGRCGREELCRPGACFVYVDGFAVWWLAVPGAASPESSEAQDQDVKRSIQTLCLSICSTASAAVPSRANETLSTTSRRASAATSAAFTRFRTSLAPDPVVCLAGPGGKIGEEVDDDVRPQLLCDAESSLRSRTRHRRRPRHRAPLGGAASFVIA